MGSTSNQRFEFRFKGYASDGYPYYWLVSQSSPSKCVAISGGSNTIGAGAVLWTCADTFNFYFKKYNHPSLNGDSYLTAMHSGQMLHPKFSSTAEGQQIVQGYSLGETDYRWRFQ